MILSFTDSFPPLSPKLSPLGISSCDERRVTNNDVEAISSPILITRREDGREIQPPRKVKGTVEVRPLQAAKLYIEFGIELPLTQPLQLLSVLCDLLNGII